MMKISNKNLKKYFGSDPDSYLSPRLPAYVLQSLRMQTTCSSIWHLGPTGSPNLPIPLAVVVVSDSSLYYLLLKLWLRFFAKQQSYANVARPEEVSCAFFEQEFAMLLSLKLCGARRQIAMRELHGWQSARCATIRNAVHAPCEPPCCVRTDPNHARALCSSP